ncbi:hypothetical protein [Sphingomonas guangdongensis]|uniref:hypothetical protein n=1 Tax=Sphingomonas guangdongensis TaxID=1141890 RepID=UPI0015CB115F|nr:hypothetical protein [Sphingomonas guangdongensis]
MNGDWVRVLARIAFLTPEQGGRTHSLEGPSSYRPNHNFFGPDDRDMCMGFIEIAEGERVQPGDTIEKAISLSVFPEVQDQFREGREWRVQEGGRLVAIGHILRVLN